MTIQGIGEEYGFNKKIMKKLKEITPDIELQKVEFGERGNRNSFYILLFSGIFTFYFSNGHHLDTVT